MKRDEFLKPESRFSRIEDLAKGQCLFFDVELTQCFSQIKSLYDTFKNARKRFERKDTLQISSSATQYMQNVRDSQLYPYVLYDFVNKDVRICVHRLHHKYYVYVVGYSPDTRFYHSVEPYHYGGFDDLSDACQMFLDIVRDYLRFCFKELF